MAKESIFTQTTRDIRVTAVPMYLDDQSDAAEDHYVWAYTITIENLGSVPVRLVNRMWDVTDGHGQVQHVRGAGVVGEQPTIEPQEAFQYTSGTVLSASSGLMVGAYEMEYVDSGDVFMVQIPAFSLDSPAPSVPPELSGLTVNNCFVARVHL